MLWPPPSRRGLGGYLSCPRWPTVGVMPPLLSSGYGGHDAVVRPGVPVSDTVRVLRELAAEARNAVGGGGLSIETVRDQYLVWVEKAELQLRSRFSSDIWETLLSDRYWHIQVIDGSSARPFPVISNEARLQADRLEKLAGDLESFQGQFRLAPGCAPAVPDTNALVHYRRFDEVDWTKIVHSATVRLLMPLLVIDELDDLSFRSRAVSDRARSVLRSIRHLRGDRSPDEPCDVRRGVTMQILVDPPRHTRLPNNDSELLERVEHLNALVGQGATLITADYGLQLRAGVRGLPWIRMPAELRLPHRTRE